MLAISPPIICVRSIRIRVLEPAFAMDRPPETRENRPAANLSHDLQHRAVLLAAPLAAATDSLSPFCRRALARCQRRRGRDAHLALAGGVSARRPCARG